MIFSSLDIWYYITRFIISYICHFNNYYLYLNKLKSFDLVKIFLLGHSEINIAHWYVPFIMLIFIFSKFFIKFITIKFKIQLWIIIILMLLSMLIHRRYESNVFALFNNVIYFTPVYLLGIFVSKNINFFYSKLNGKEFYLLIIIFLIVIIQLQQGKLENISELGEINI